MTRLPCLALTLVVISCAHSVPPPGSTEYDAVVIGGGLGGLSAAACLAAGGLKVVLLEQHHKVGGCNSSFQRGDFRFDASLHEMDGAGPGGSLRRHLERLGVLDKIELLPIPTLYRSIFPDLDFTLPIGLEQSRAALIARWPAESEAIERFYELMAELRSETDALRSFHQLSRARQLLRMAGMAVRRTPLIRYYDRPLVRLLDDLFADPGLRAVVAQLWVFYGPPPDSLWAPILPLANFSYLNYGAWHIRGSSQALADGYAARIVELGGEVVTGVRATAIEVEEGWVRGVTGDDGSYRTTRFVVSNADPFQTFFNLLDEGDSPPAWRERIKSLKPANGLVGLYLGLDRPPSFWQVADHEVFINTSYDSRAIYEAMIAGRYEEGAAAVTFYSNLGDDFYAPPGKSVVVVHAYSDIDFWSTDRERYQEQQKVVADQLLKLVERLLPGVREHIEVQEMVTPRSLAAYTLNHRGTPYGWDFTVDQVLKRLPNRTPVGGLYMAGAWTNPSHGVSAVQLSGALAAEQVLAEAGVGRLAGIDVPSETADAEAIGERARSDRPRCTLRYIDRGSEDESRQAPGRCRRNGVAIAAGIPR